MVSAREAGRDGGQAKVGGVPEQEQEQEQEQEHESRKAGAGRAKKHVT